MKIDRIAPTRRPDGRAAGYQRWRRLAFVLRRGQVHHAPYPLQPAELAAWDESLLAAAGIARPAGAPLVHFAAGVDVEVFALR